MRQSKKYARTLLALVCLSCSLVIAQQNFPQPGDPPAAKPRPAQKDAGFAPPETVAPSAPKAAERSAGFAPPETISPTGTRPAEQPAGFKPPETATASELPPKSQPVAVSSGTNPLMGSARGHFATALAIGDPRIPGATPFQMHAVFSAEDDPALASGGTYSETWLSPTSWKREAVLGNVHLSEARDGDRMYRAVTGAAWVPRRVDDLMDALARTLPPLDDTFTESDWQQGTVTLEGASYLRIANASEQPRTYWLYLDGRLRAAVENGTTTEYNDHEDFGGKQIARHIVVKNGSVKLGGIWIDQIGPAATSDAHFAVEGAQAIPLSDAVKYDGPYFVPPHPVFQPSPKDAPAGEGTMIVDVHLDPHGHVRAAKVRQGINPALDAVALQSALQWEFSPALLKGRPTASDATVQFQF